MSGRNTFKGYLQYNEKERNIKNIVFDSHQLFDSSQNFDPRQNFMDPHHPRTHEPTHPRYPRHPRYVADSVCATYRKLF